MSPFMAATWTGRTQSYTLLQDKNHLQHHQFPCAHGHPLELVSPSTMEPPGRNHWCPWAPPVQLALGGCLSPPVLLAPVGTTHPAWAHPMPCTALGAPGTPLPPSGSLSSGKCALGRLASALPAPGSCCCHPLPSSASPCHTPARWKLIGTRLV